MDRYVDITLEYPITIDGVEVGALRMRRATARDEIAYQKRNGSPGEKAVALFASLCEVPADAVLSMDVADFSKLEEAYTGFRPSPSGTSGER